VIRSCKMVMKSNPYQLITICCTVILISDLSWAKENILNYLEVDKEITFKDAQLSMKSECTDVYTYHSNEIVGKGCGVFKQLPIHRAEMSFQEPEWFWQDSALTSATLNLIGKKRDFLSLISEIDMITNVYKNKADTNYGCEIRKVQSFDIVLYHDLLVDLSVQKHVNKVVEETNGDTKAAFHQMDDLFSNKASRKVDALTCSVRYTDGLFADGIFKGNITHLTIIYYEYLDYSNLNLHIILSPD
jgi:hypothetical protein